MWPIRIGCKHSDNNVLFLCLFGLKRTLRSLQNLKQHLFCHCDRIIWEAILCHCIFKCDRFRIPPFASVRFGEAKNPGPRDHIEDSMMLKVTVTNPTSVCRKTSFLQALDCDLVWGQKTPASLSFLVQNAGFGASFGDFLGSNFWTSFVTEASLKFSTSIFKCDRFRIPPFASVRFGEAKNPGPGDTIEDYMSLKVAVTNPTSVYRKTSFLQALGCDLIALSETSATREVQRREGIALRQCGYTNVWGAPVSPQTSSQYGDSLRGASLGVSIHCRYPLRPSRIEPTDWELSGRLVHGFVKLHTLELQIIVIYGFPANLPQSKARTEQLLQCAIEKMRYTTHPTIICGDLNHHPNTLGSGDALRQAGFVTAEQIYRAKNLVELPPTYGNSTRNDIAFLSPILASWVDDVQVDQQHLFAGHNPLLFTLRIPHAPLFRTTWRLPKTWIELCPDKDGIGQHFAALKDDITIQQIECPLEAWSSQVEKAVHLTLKDQHLRDSEKFPSNGLSKHHWGRCKKRDVIQAPLPTSIKQAWGGHYTPNTDHPSMQLKQLTKQMRRVQSLKHRVLKFERQGMQHGHEFQLVEEWTAIMKAAGFKSGFACWIGQFVELQPVPLDVPHSGYLYDLEQLLKFHTDDLVSNLNRQSKVHAKFMANLDQKLYGKKEAFRKTKETGPGVLTQIHTETSFKALILQQPGDGTIQIKLKETDCLDVSKSFQINGQIAEPIDFRPPVLEAMIHNADQTFDIEVDITQERLSVDPDEIADELNKYWQQFWGAHDWNSVYDEDSWPDFQYLLAGIRRFPDIAIQTNSVNLWQNAITKLKATTSRGICGWAADELKLLPTKAIEGLIEAFESILHQGMPQWMMCAKTIPLAKEEHASHPKKTRPITVLSLLYRLWGRCMTQQILQAWSKILPTSCTGFLPGRDPHWMIYKLQVLLERTQYNNQQSSLGGLTLDIVKCFNCLPRLPCKLLLNILGVPTHILEFWYKSINRMTRNWQIDGQMLKGLAASAGLPEGDTWSVLAMIAVNVHLDEVLKHLDLILNTYADNWSYATDDPSKHLPAVRLLLQFARALKLTLDWNKTWIWGTDDDHREALKQVGRDLLPAEVELQKVNFARELGYILHYRLQAFRGTQQERHDKALIRLKKLQRLPVTLQTKAHIAQSSCVTKALFGTHLYLAGKRYFEELRGAICNALTGGKHNAQPYLACMCLSKYVCDPELFAIRQSILHAREFLTFATPDDFVAFLSIASQTSKKPAQLLGPAGAFAAYIGKLGWQCGMQGDLQVSAFVTLHIVHSNLEVLFEWSERAWMQYVSETVSTRKNLRSFPLVDNKQTIRVFSAMPDEVQKVLALDLTGGFMIKSQKQHFDSTETLQCDFCEMEDSYEHRILHCAATQTIRDRYPQVVEFLTEHNHLHVLFPLHYEAPWKEFHMTLHMNQAEPATPIFDVACSEIFTDGSCQLPSEVNSRWAAFAAVKPISTKQQILSLSKYDAKDLLQHHFEIVTVGLCKGDQTIPRAELQCVLALLPQPTQVTIVTDSNYVLYAKDLVLGTQDVRMLHKQANYDLLQKLHRQTQAHPMPGFRKVRAHQTLSCSDMDLRWDRIGNMVADEAAKAAANNLAKDFTTDLRRQADTDRQMRQHLQQQYMFRYEMSVLRAKKAQSARSGEQADQDMQLRDVLNWDPQPNVQFAQPPEMVEISKISRWGQKFSMLVMQWLATLIWPTEAERTSPPVGITWIELIINFLLTTQHSIPVKQTDTGGGWRYVCRETHPQFDFSQFNFGQVCLSFSGCLRHLQHLAMQPLLPSLDTTHVRSIYILGGNVFKNGLRHRPKMALQEETMNLTQLYLVNNKHGGKTIFDAIPEVTVQDPIIFNDLESLPGDNHKEIDRRVRMWLKQRR